MFAINPSIENVTQIEKSYFDETRNRSVPATLWYNTEETCEKRPLIIYSHGWNRDESNSARYRKGWIRQILLQNGYNICSIEHLDDNVHLVGRRAEDIDFIINQLSKDILLKEYMDSAPIGVMGFSKGGATCISAIGGRLRLLDLNEDEFTIGLGKEHVEKINDYHKKGDFSIPRIKAAVLLQPGWLRRFDPTSLANTNVPTLILDKQNEESIEASIANWTTNNKKVTKFELPGNSHYVLLDEPTEADKKEMSPELYSTLFEEGMEGINRQDVHRKSAEEIVRFFNQHLKKIK